MKIFQKACQRLTPQTKAALRVDILSRIIRMYSNAGQDSLKHIYLKQMDETLQEIISREPEARKNWTNFEIDCQLKYGVPLYGTGEFSCGIGTYG